MKQALCLSMLIIVSMLCCSHRAGRAQQPAALVEVVPLVQKTLSQAQTFTGTVVPPRRSIVGSAVDGRVESVQVEEGDVVRREVVDQDGTTKPGTLAQLRTATIRLELEAAKAQLDAVSQGYNQLEVTVPQEIVQARAIMLSGEALMNYHQSRHARALKLLQNGSAVSVEEVDESKSAWVAAQQAFAASKSKFEQLEGTASARLAQAKATQAAQQAEVDRSQDILGKYTIRVPFDGFVVKKYTEVGAWLSRGDPVAEVIELDPVEIEVFVPDRYIAKVALGELVNVMIDALPDQLIEGQVARIIPEAEPQSRSFPVRVRVKNPRFLIKAGMLVRAAMSVGPPGPVLLAPKDALVLDGDRRAVVVADGQGDRLLAKIVPVEVGLADGSLIEVRGELKEGQRVVVRGNERLRPGQPLQLNLKRAARGTP